MNSLKLNCLLNSADGTKSMRELIFVVLSFNVKCLLDNSAYLFLFYNTVILTRILNWDIL